MVAYSFGPYALAGLCREERMLYLNGHKPEELLIHDNEREWGMWKDIGYERYQVYFPLS